MFNLLYLYLLWDLFVRAVCVWKRERVCEDSRQIKDWSVFAGSSRVSIPRSDACALHMIGMQRVKDKMETTGFRECLIGKAFSWDTCETVRFAILSYLVHYILIHTIYSIITHRCWGVLLKKNPSDKPWELENVIPIILYTIACEFSLTPTSPFPYHWEVDNPNTYHTLSECSVRF